MLQTVKEQVSKDGEEDSELFGKYMMFCWKGREALEKAIEEAEEADLDSLKTSIEGAEETRKGIEDHLAEDKAKQEDVQTAMAKAKTLRDSEASFFKKESDKLREDIKTMKLAIKAHDRGDGLTTTGIQLLKQISGSSDMKPNDKDAVKAFLQKIKDGEEETVPHKDQIRLLLKVADVMQKKLEALVKEERVELDDFRDYKAMIKDKSSFLAADIKQVSKEAEDLDEKMNSDKDELEDAARYLFEGRAFLPFLQPAENCSKREEEWHKRCKTRTKELVALTQTMNTLTDDDFLDELYAKGVPGPWKEGADHARIASRHAKEMNQEKPSSFQTDLFALALQGKNASFNKFFQVLDGMTNLLGKDGADSQPERFCGQSMNETEDKLKRLTVTVSNLGAVIAKHEKNIQVVTSEINEAKEDIQKLEKDILATGKVRKQEHDDNSEQLATDNMTVTLVSAARDRLHGYYSAEDEEEPETDGASLSEIIGPYLKKQDEGLNIVEMLVATLEEVKAEMKRVEAKERQEQLLWEASVRKSVKAHAHSVQILADKQGAKADHEASLNSAGREKNAKLKDVKATSKYLSQLQKNHTGFLQPVVCGRREAKGKPFTAPLPKNLIFW